MAVRSVANESLPLGRTAAQPRQVGFGGRLVDEDQPRRVERALAPLPAPSGAGHIRPVLLSRMERLFLYVSPSRLTTQWTAATVQSNSKRAFISARVRSGSWAINRFSFAPCSGISLALRPENRCRGLRSPVLARCPNNFFTIPNETLKRLATSSLVPSWPS